jgi:hypothetical protein
MSGKTSQSVKELILKFFELLLNEGENTLLELKDLIMTWYENGDLSATEHCDLEAIIDAKLYRL